MGKKLYVGNLSYDMTNTDLENLFAAARHGPVGPGHHGPGNPAARKASALSRWTAANRPRRPLTP